MAVHGEHAVSDHQAMATALVRSCHQLRLQVGHVHVAKAVSLGLKALVGGVWRGVQKYSTSYNAWRKVCCMK